MCLIILSYKVHPSYPLILIANRDEFYQRPTKFAHWQNNTLGGLDLQAGGMWLGVNKRGYIAAVTNYRDAHKNKEGLKSRGKIVSNFLQENAEIEKYCTALEKSADDYNGYNCILGTFTELFYYSNIEKKRKVISPGIHGLSNHLLDTPWPKVCLAKQRFQDIHSSKPFDIDGCFDILQDRKVFPDEELPHTGVDQYWERTLSSIFIRTDTYGSRCSTVIIVDKHGNVSFYERSFDQTKKIHQCEYFFRRAYA